jgi:hypothetical protein
MSLMQRRTILKQGIATLGVASLTPPSLLPADAPRGRSSSPKYLFVLEGNGLPQRQIHPQNVPFIPLGSRDRFQEFKLTDLPMALEPVGDYMNNMCIVQGITGSMCGGGHSNDHGTLGSFNARDGKLIPGPTIDYLLGTQNKDRIFENVVLGINGPDRDVIFNVSAAGKNQPIATLCNPVAAYNRMFGALGNKSEVAKDSALIEYLRRDAERTQRRLGQKDWKLQKYSDAFATIDQRNQRIGWMKSIPIPDLTDKYRSQDHVEMLDAHFEMAAAALAGDLTDSATIAVGSGFEHFQIQMNSLEGVESPRHNLGHMNMKGTDPSVAHAGHHEAALVRKYVFQLIARTLANVDNLVVIYTSDAAEKHHSNCDEWPHVILGNHPNLKLDGRFLYYPENGTKGQRTLNAFHNTLLHAGGIEMESFGQIVKNVAKKAQVGTLPELLS